MEIHLSFFCVVKSLYIFALTSQETLSYTLPALISYKTYYSGHVAPQSPFKHLEGDRGTSRKQR